MFRFQIESIIFKLLKSDFNALFSIHSKLLKLAVLLVIDLPAIDAAYSTDFSIEFFAFSPLTGKFYCRHTHFRFCLKTVIYLFHLG